MILEINAILSSCYKHFTRNSNWTKAKYYPFWETENDYFSQFKTIKDYNNTMQIKNNSALLLLEPDPKHLVSEMRAA